MLHSPDEWSGDLDPGLLQGTADVLLLKALTWGPRHGFAISRWLRTASDGLLNLEDAGLYQALHRLEAQGLLESDWGLSENNRRARFYQLTPRGRRRLNAEMTSWHTYAAAVGRVLATRTAER